MENRGKITYYADKTGEWRWRVQARNNFIIADGAEGYKNKADCINGFHRLCELVGGNPAAVTVEFPDDK